jgi:hypothetical protein
MISVSYRKSGGPYVRERQGPLSLPQWLLVGSGIRAGTVWQRPCPGGCPTPTQGSFFSVSGFSVSPNHQSLLDDETHTPEFNVGTGAIMWIWKILLATPNHR